MPRNDNLQLSDPINLLRVIGRVADQNENEFGVVATGPEDQVKTFIETLPIHLEIQPWKGLAETAKGGRQPVEEPPEITPEELAGSLVVKVGLITLQTGPPYVLRAEVEPFLAAGLSHYYWFTDIVQACIKCTTLSGNANLYLYERWRDGVWYWIPRCSSTWATVPVDDCYATRWYTGDWLVRVTAVVDSTYTLSGDLYVP